MKVLVTALLTGLLAGMPAQAQSQKSMVPELNDASRKGEMARLAQKKSNEKFEAADEDKNGTLSRTEVAKHFPYFDQNFERYDLNKDGVLSWEEYVGHSKWQREAQAK